MVDDVAAWPWSSYRATAGEVPVPSFLNRDWLLSQFGGTNATTKAYASFVRKEESGSPWEALNGPDILGGDDFRGGLPQQQAASQKEIPRRKRILRHLPLAEIASAGKDGSDWMREAYREHGYTMQAIAEHAGLHHSTVSRLIKKGNENALNKT